ncbi:MAG: hypothetical protein O7G88_07050, partial [bacterium]|nr:hypothetical protein [bacterium]
GRGPSEAGLVDTRRCDGGWVDGELEMAQYLTDDRCLIDGGDEAQPADTPDRLPYRGQIPASATVPSAKQTRHDWRCPHRCPAGAGWEQPHLAGYYAAPARLHSALGERAVAGSVPRAFRARIK